ncbi:hypothetical protein COY95_00840, partial [Candidatus Woesearchaeota archaeon CG_4_10_14_0_8_um_filter_47_5]
MKRTHHAQNGQLTQSKIVGAILIIIVGVLLLIFVGGFFELLKSKSDSDLCRKSVQDMVLARKAVTIEGSDLTDLLGMRVNLNCPTHYYRIKDKEDDVIKRAVADEMAGCWDRFGRGELEIFDTKDNNYCVVCSRLEFSEKKEIPGFNRFLLEENARILQEDSSSFTTPY